MTVVDSFVPFVHARNKEAYTYLLSLRTYFFILEYKLFRTCSSLRSCTPASSCSLMPASVNLSDIELVKWRSTVHAPARMNAAFEVKHGEDQRGQGSIY